MNSAPYKVGEVGTVQHALRLRAVQITVTGTISENSTCPVLTICSPDLRPFSVIGTSLFSPARQCTELQ